MIAARIDLNTPNHPMFSMLLVGPKKTPEQLENQRALFLFLNCCVMEDCGDETLLNYLSQKELRIRLFQSDAFQKMLEKVAKSGVLAALEPPALKMDEQFCVQLAIKLYQFATAT